MYYVKTLLTLEEFFVLYDPFYTEFAQLAGLSLADKESNLLDSSYWESF